MTLKLMVILVILHAVIVVKLQGMTLIAFFLFVPMTWISMPLVRVHCRTEQRLIVSVLSCPHDPNQVAENG